MKQLEADIEARKEEVASLNHQLEEERSMRAELSEMYTRENAEAQDEFTR